MLGIIIHESGHIIAAIAVKAPAKGISTQHFGISLYYDFSGLSYAKELFVHISGAAANFISAALAFYLFDRSVCIDFFVLSSLSFGIFNLIPFRKSDGGRALSAALSIVFNVETQEKLTYIFHFISVLFFWSVSVYLQFIYTVNISLLILSVYLLLDFILA